MNSIYETIRSLCAERGIKGARLCADLGISKGLLTDLKAGRKKGMSAATADKIASYFGVSVGYILGTEPKKAPAREGASAEATAQAKLALFGGDEEVTDEMWEEAIFAAQLIKERHKRKKEEP